LRRRDWGLYRPGNERTDYRENGKEQVIKTDSVVIAVGMKARDDLALQFYGAGDRLFTIGDCNKAGDVQKAMHSAFSAASML
jgi:hypothetical protein